MMKNLVNILFGTKRPRYTEAEFDFKTINSVLIKPIGYALGDSIIHITHLKQLKENYPHLKLGVLVTDRCRTVYSEEKFIDILIEDKPNNYLKQRKQWDLYLDFQPTFTSRSIFLDWLLAPKFIINFGKENKKHYNLQETKNYDFSTPNLAKIHISQYLFHSVLSPYLPNKYPYYHLNRQQLSPMLTERCWQAGKIRILLSPQGSCKEIPPQELRKLLQSIVQPEKVSLLLSSTPSYWDYADRLHLNDLVKLSPKTSLQEYFALVDSADLVISVDSASVHIACAYAKPLIAFYANFPASIFRWQPNNTADTFVSISQLPAGKESAATSDFDMAEAAKWLNLQIDLLAK